MRLVKKATKVIILVTEGTPLACNKITIWKKGKVKAVNVIQLLETKSFQFE